MQFFIKKTRIFGKKVKNFWKNLYAKLNLCVIMHAARQSMPYIKKKEGIFLKKADFIKATAAKAGVTQKEAQAVVAAAHEVIKAALKKGDTVPFLGFGTFKVSNRAARTGRNPQTGEAIKIAAAKLPTFKASPAFKEFINNIKKTVAAKKAAAKKKK